MNTLTKAPPHNSADQTKEQAPHTPSEKPRVSRTLLASGLVFFIIFSASTAFAFYTLRYEDKALPGVVIGGVSVAGMDEAQIKEALNARFNDMIENDLFVSHDGQSQRIDLETSDDPEFNFSLITLDFNASADTALSYGHRGPWYQRLWEGVRAPVSKTILVPQFTISDTALVNKVREAFSDIEDPGTPTDFVFDPTFTSVSITQGTRGTEIDTKTFLRDLGSDIADLHLDTVSLRIINSPEPLTITQAQAVAGKALELVERAPITLTYTTDTKREYEWVLEKELLADSLVPSALPSVDIGLQEEKLNALLEEIEGSINIAPVDARFQVANGKVTEFVGSKDGVALDRELTLENILAYLQNPTTTPEAVSLSVKTTEPDTSTGEVNDLGITEVLGMGWSGWKGSPPNRIKNIRHATQKLDGLLIKPGEQISLTSKLGPLTLEDGYLPEMVIAGDEIKPEIAGGLCQIGTTVFRAAMNSGLEIDERRNHSLVVSYYNDPSNGNPGTDATLYEPVLDLKFTNTTDHHILLTAEFDEVGQQLFYTFWGTSDGRKAYYTPPQVLSRTAPGPTVYKETTNLAPGQMKCQHAYTGASTTFDYIVEHPDGTRDVQTYDSYYRALPQICLVGVDPNAAPTEDPEGGAGTEITPESAENAEEDIPAIE